MRTTLSIPVTHELDVSVQAQLLVPLKTLKGILCRIDLPYLYSPKSWDGKLVNFAGKKQKRKKEKYELSPLFLRIWHFSSLLQKTLNFIPWKQNPLIKAGIYVVHKTEIFLQLKAENHKSILYLQCFRDS